MKRIFGYLIGLLTLFGVFAMIFIAAMYHDVSNKTIVEPHFLRTGVDADRPALPQTASEIGNRRLRDWLIQKFVVDFFYVNPDVDNIDRRTTPSTMSPVYVMAAPGVYKQWQRDVAPGLREMAAAGVRQTVTVFDEIYKPDNSNFFRVDYELKTWTKPNDMGAEPIITRGTMYLAINENIIGQVRSPESLRKIIEKGWDPSLAFSFLVEKIILPGGVK